VVGLDPSEPLVATARTIDAQRGVHIDYVIGAAERMPFNAKSFDVVAAGQSWHWLDRTKAMREVRRVLRPGGWLVIAHFDWLPLPGNAVAATEKLIEKYNPEWRLGGGTGIYPAWLTDVRQAGFTAVETFSFDVMLSFTHDGWRGRVRASAGVKASLALDEVARFDETLRRTLAERFPAEPLSLPHCVWALSCRLPE
jgi:SAM-dependent methyltransferase